MLDDSVEEINMEQMIEDLFVEILKIMQMNPWEYRLRQMIK